MLTFCNHVFKVQFLLILLPVFAGIFYPEILQRIQTIVLEYLDDRIQATYRQYPQYTEKLFTKSELNNYNGKGGTELYLSLLGSVYDVTKGRRHYGAGCAYNFFVGRDASVSFITGKFDSFNEETADDVNILKSADLLSLENWKSFYDKEYTQKGKLVGRFYDENGAKTKYYDKFHALVQQAKIAKEKVDKMREVYPDCNIEWSAATGTRVWCTNSSGGKHRDWSGYPRKLFEERSDSFRCVCVRMEDLLETRLMIKPYDNCDKLSNTCYYNVNN